MPQHGAWLQGRKKRSFTAEDTCAILRKQSVDRVKRGNKVERERRGVLEGNLDASTFQYLFYLERVSPGGEVDG